MIIPLIKKDTDANDFTCRDGEIECIWHFDVSGSQLAASPSASSNFNVSCPLTPKGTFPTANIRIALQPGEKEKAGLLLNGEISRVDPATAERITQAILQKAAETLLQLSTELRRQGLFILPFRFYTLTVCPDGTLSYPSPQAIALPTDFPPQPEITASSITDDAIVLSLRFPVRPHRLTIIKSDNFPTDHSIRLFISYPLYIPDPKEIRGNLGNVTSATGGIAFGIRFAFLTASAIKASVAAPEKYYEMVGNERTGYRISSRMASTPDYSSYLQVYGYVPPFSGESLLALGSGVDAATDPLDWIADWINVEDGYLPVSLPYKYREYSSDTAGSLDAKFPEGIEAEDVGSMAETLDMPWILLTRPMAFSSDIRSRRNATPRAIRSIQIQGLSDAPSLGILYGSDDCSHWEALRSFDPHRNALVLTPRRAWWRVLIFSREKCGNAAISISF